MDAAKEESSAQGGSDGAAKDEDRRTEQGGKGRRSFHKIFCESSDWPSCAQHIVSLCKVLCAGRDGRWVVGDQ